jgi:hypothetical protein
MINVYEKAIREAKEELKLANEAAEKLDRQRAKLRQVIIVLQSLAGKNTVDHPVKNRSITDATLEIIQAADGKLTTSEILEGLHVSGYTANARTVATTLSRFVRTRQIKKESDGYRWRGSVAIDPDRA